MTSKPFYRLKRPTTVRYTLFGVLLFSLITLALPQLAHAWYNGQPATLVLGQPNFTVSTLAAGASGMDFPVYTALDSVTGKVFVADEGNNRVLRFASLGSLSSGATAEAVLGQPNFTSTSHSTSQNTMFFPSAVTLDTNGTLWVSDGANGRVLRFDNAVNKTNGANADGVLGKPDFTSNSPQDTQSGMNYPNSLVVDS